MSDKVWKWDYKLSWELFSEAVYSYRQAIKENQKHKLHMNCKNGIFAAITSLEAFMNESLISQHSFNETDLKVCEHKKLKILIPNFSKNKSYYKKYEKYKNIRNDSLVHHKRDDHLYAEKINPYSLLEAIESVQEIIARISFCNRDIPYPYWISGLNLINPRENNDITLDTNQAHEFWRHIGTSSIDNSDLIVFNSMMLSINYPEDWEKYEKLYLDIWGLLLEYDFDFDIEEKSVRFPHTLYLSCKYWE